MNSTTPTPTRGTRRPVRLGALAFVGLALVGTGFGITAAPAQAAEANWWESVVLPRADDGTVYAYPECMKFVRPGATVIEIEKTDQDGNPVEATFDVVYSPGTGSTHRISESSWQEVRDPALESVRISTFDAWMTAQTDLSAASQSFNTANSAVGSAQRVLDAAQLRVNDAQAAVDAAEPGSQAAADAEANLAVQTEDRDAAQVVLDEATATLAEAKPTYDAALVTNSETGAAAQTAAESVSAHLMATGEIDAWQVTTTGGDAHLETLGCGDGSYSITEVSTEDGIDPAGIGAVLEIAADGTVTSQDESVFTNVEIAPGEGHDKVITVSAVNERLPEVPVEPTPTPTPEVPVTPTPTTVTVTPAPQAPVAPAAAKPVVSG
ncbi:hypothetical protein C5B85_10910 [Pseudoclavibacter sp. AY1F1]|uniref:hypothetical protein n=1 Tax=Pseudoclavibacter sp. AY1F1 TaxID=2080583 RepID=UPI000CE728CF|nr:hypothetical protein [Pseudoclavibacter sp. AY1F1]PPF44148.1 hypothetical protein C5B85_10910 [Pseudoclavibacter sp. AY1F1]